MRKHVGYQRKRELSGWNEQKGKFDSVMALDLWLVSG